MLSSEPNPTSVQTAIPIKSKIPPVIIIPLLLIAFNLPRHPGDLPRGGGPAII